MTATVNPDKLALLDDLTLHPGGHRDFESGHCAMEVVSWLADQGFTDAPSCASPVLRRFTITLNDRWGHDKRQALKPFLPRMVGTGGDGKDALREQIAGQYVASLLAPWLRLAGLGQEADAMPLPLPLPLPATATATASASAYKAARKYYEDHPLPIAQEVAELSASQQGVALELLEKMIDPAVAS